MERDNFAKQLQQDVMNHKNVHFTPLVPVKALLTLTNTVILIV